MASAKLKAQTRLGEWLRDLGFPAPIENHVFSETRKFELDWAWPHLSIAIEVEGGVWSGGAHGRGTGIERDIEKHNLAILEGWKVFRVTTRQAEKGDCLMLIGKAFGLKITMMDIERFAPPGRRTLRLKKLMSGEKKPARKKKPIPASEVLKSESALGLNLGNKPLFRRRR